jgi:hypothetical protein
MRKYSDKKFIERVAFRKDYDDWNDLVRSGRDIKRFLKENGATIFAEIVFDEENELNELFTLFDLAIQEYASLTFPTIVAPKDDAMKLILENVKPGHEKNPIFHLLLFGHFGTLSRGEFRAVDNNTFETEKEGEKIVKIDNINAEEIKQSPTYFVINGFLIGQRVEKEALNMVFVEGFLD